MKAQRMIRMQLMLMGLGAALMLASSARAQQDMDPTDFPVNPGTQKVDTRAVVQTAQAPAIVKTADSNPAAAALLLNGEATQQEADLARLTILDGTMVLILATGVGLIVLYAMAATRRERRLQVSPQSIPHIS